MWILCSSTFKTTFLSTHFGSQAPIQTVLLRANGNLFKTPNVHPVSATNTTFSGASRPHDVKESNTALTYVDFTSEIHVKD